MLSVLQSVLIVLGTIALSLAFLGVLRRVWPVTRRTEHSGTGASKRMRSRSRSRLSQSFRNNPRNAEGRFLLVSPTRK